MLNLLIAIISESYAAVRANADEAYFRELSSLVAENSHLVKLENVDEDAKKYTVMDSSDAMGGDEDETILETTEREMTVKLNAHKEEFRIDIMEVKMIIADVMEAQAEK